MRFLIVGQIPNLASSNQSVRHVYILHFAPLEKPELIVAATVSGHIHIAMSKWPISQFMIGLATPHTCDCGL